MISMNMTICWAMSRAAWNVSQAGIWSWYASVLFTYWQSAAGLALRDFSSRSALPSAGGR
jgi:hypothetical protein